ncbi:MAG: VWA domain-containing protein [Terracidiphilus sp.]
MATRVFRLGLLLLSFALPVFAARPVSVEQLRQQLLTFSAKRDAEAARQIADLKLTERMTRDQESELEKTLPGEKSRQALLAVVDQSAFLSPPAQQTPQKPAPDLAEQRRLMAQVVNYVVKTVPKLPDFLATRTTIRFADSPQRLDSSLTRYEPLHVEGADRAQVGYLDGREVADNEAKGAKDAAARRGLQSWGEFGPILSTVLLDAAQNKLAWLRWELAGAETLAVFSYSVPKERSHFEIDYCCTTGPAGESRAFHAPAGYTGEMAVDPDTGTIYRLEIEAEFKAGEPITKAEIAVEYSPVEIGGKTYICPVHGIALSLGQSLAEEKQQLVPTAPIGMRGAASAPVAVYTGTEPAAAEQTLLNDVTFTQYHVFRSETRIVPAEGVQPPPPGAAQAESAGPGTNETQAAPAANTGSTAAPQAGTAAGTESTTPAEAASAAAPAPAAPAPPEIPEISLTTATELPGPPSAPEPPAPAPQFTFRATARLVDVNVTAFDKKGNPVTNLKPEDFAVLDNGVKQKIRFVSEASEAPATPAAASPSQSAEANVPPVYSNLPDAGSMDGRASVARGKASVTILMIDTANVAFGDLSYARGEMLRFLKSLPSGEPVGICVMGRHGFNVLQEPKTDHATLAAALAKWMPNALDLAQAQQEEDRNRQNIDYVHHVTDLLSANGNTPTDALDEFGPPDPQLRSVGDNPSRDVLAALQGVARRLAAIPGHKSLVWVASDNVLADFSEKEPGSEKGGKNLEPLALRARETLNEANVSLYPLDVSQLEAGGVGANLEAANVQLNPVTNVQVDMAALPPGEKEEALEALTKSQRDGNPGRLTSSMQQDTHPIQGVFRDLATATGGRALPRASDIAAELNSIVSDDRATYLLSFAPETPPDNAEHRLTVEIPGRNGIALRYRTGYFYAKEPANLKERFQQAVWQPADVNEIAITATPQSDAQGRLLRLNVAGAGLALAQQGDRWADRLDIFLVERDDASAHAKVSGVVEALRLLPATYERTLRDGLAFDQRIPSLPKGGVVRVVVVDENSGRMGTITVQSSAFGGNP